MDMYYAGIGSRETPPEVQQEMEDLAAALATAGFTLRSGGADGADSAFERGAQRVQGKMEIFLPWQGFNNNPSPLSGVSPEALALAQTVHPRWDMLGQGPRKMHGRNCYQVLGRTLDLPAAAVICWTPDGCETEAKRTRNTGGTATGIVLGLRRGIPVFNLQAPGARARLNKFLESHGVPFRLVEQDESPPQGALF
jgi:hypothetical protein